MGTIHDKWVAFAEVWFRNEKPFFVDSDVENDNKLAWCLRCGAIIMNNCQEEHKKFHKQIDEVTDNFLIIADSRGK